MWWCGLVSMGGAYNGSENGSLPLVLVSILFSCVESGFVAGANSLERVIVRISTP